MSNEVRLKLVSLESEIVILFTFDNIWQYDLEY